MPTRDDPSANGINPAAVTTSVLMENWSDDEVLDLAAAIDCGCIDTDSLAFDKARDQNMIDLGPAGYIVRKSVAAGVKFQLRIRGLTPTVSWLRGT